MTPAARDRLSRATIAIAMLWSCAGGHAVAATTFPGAAPCNTTLQACVTAAAGGDTVELATNALVNEDVLIDKSLTLQSASGFAPQLLAVTAMSTAGDIDVTVTKLAITGSIFGACRGAGNLTLRVVQNSISAGNDDAIEVGDNGCTTGTKTIFVTGNSIVQPPDNINSAIVLEAGEGSFQATISDNDIALSGLNNGGGIILFSIGGHDAAATIARNRIHGSNYNEGIEVRSDGPGGLLSASIFNNLIAGQNGNSGGPGGIAIRAVGSVDATIINNTIVDGRNAMNIDVPTAPGASLTGTIVNNIIARQSDGGIGVRTMPPGLSNSNNLFFANVGGNSSGFIPGPGTRGGDPAFSNPGAGDYSLTSTSDAIDRGKSALAPSGFDLAGNARVQGTAVDIGALESPFALAQPPAPLAPAPTLGGIALLALFGLLLGAGAISLRARSR
jgi:hypothetical protein